MLSVSCAALTEKIVEKAKALGADIAGVTHVETLKASPSHRICPKIGTDLAVRWQEAKNVAGPGAVAWPADARSAVVIGVAHNAENPELDWWDGKGTPGNRILMRINADLAQWIERTFSIRTYKLPYLIEKGGIFLKDAAVMAGLGCIGKNNLVVTPRYGPRIRFRVLLMDHKAEATGPVAFDPCENCSEPCRKACPVKAFEHTVYSAEALEQTLLPGINGTYDRVTCNVKMEKDIDAAVTAMASGNREREAVRQAIDAFEAGPGPQPNSGKHPLYWVRYCRQCELACPVGVQGRTVLDRK